MIEVRKKKYFNKVYFFVVILFFFSLIFFLSSFYLNSNFVLDKMEVPIILEVGNISGFNVDSSILNFGVLVSQSSAQRNVVLRNDYNFPVKVIVDSRGNVSNFLNFEKEFILEVNQTKEVVVSTIIFNDEQHGVYTGSLFFEISKNY